MAGIYDFVREEYEKAKKAFGLIGGIPKTFKNNPRNAETMDAIFGLGGIVPGVGDAVSAAEAKYRYDQGDMLGAGLAGVGALPLVPSMAGMFIGKGAKTWDVVKADQAMKMERSGASPREIWAQTGNWKGPDGQWRQEIPDNAATTIKGSELKKRDSIIEFNDETGERVSLKLPDVYQHQDLYDAYPQLRKTNAYGIDRSGPQGRSGGSVGLNVGLNKLNMRSHAAHEVQHEIQRHEGFAKGGNYLDRDYHRLAGEAEARATQARMNMDMPQRLATFPEDSYDVPMDQLIVRYGDGPAMAINPSEYGLPVNPDGTVSLLHGTTKDAANKIIGENRLRSAGEPSVYLTNAKDAGYGDGTLVQVDVDPRKLFLDDEFPGGRFDFSMPVRGGVANVKNARMYGDGPSMQRNSSDLLASFGVPVASTALLAALLAKPEEAQAK